MSILFALAILLTAISADAQTSAFTYQGRLTDTSVAANGTYQMQFALYDAVAGGTQIGTNVENTSVSVSSGIFTVALDFGGGAFPGADRYLEISVRRNSGESYVVLTPRQRITSAPYAIRALAAGTADNAASLGGTSAANYVQTNDARLSDERAPSGGSANYIQNTTTQQSSANFNISGNGTAGGTMSANIVNAQAQFNLVGGRFASAPGNSNTFVGHDAGTANTTGFENSFFGNGAGRSTTSGAQNTFVGPISGRDNTGGNGNAFVGYRAGLKNSTGSYNVFIGWDSGRDNTAAGFNTFLGGQAGYLNTIGGGNTFLGGAAGGNNLAGSSNVFLGFNSGFFNTNGNNNTTVGSGANVSVGTLTFATAIGADSVVGTSNTVVLGRPAGTDNVRIPGTLTAGAANLSGCDLVLADDICFFDEQNGTLSVRNFAGTAYAPIKASAFNVSSSISYKKNVTLLGSSAYDSMLKRLIDLPLFTYRYKSETLASRLHTGLIAERSPASLLAADGKAIDLYDFASLNAGATKALATRVESLSAENTEQRAQIEKQQKQIDELKQVLCSLKPDAATCVGSIK